MDGFAKFNLQYVEDDIVYMAMVYIWIFCPKKINGCDFVKIK